MFDRTKFDRELKKLDPYAQAGYYLAFHIRFSSPLLFFHTYHPAWVQRYTEKGYVLRDPAVAWAFATSGATRWSDQKIPDPFGIFAEARNYGLRYGITISHGPLVSRTVANLARSDREFTDQEIEKLSTIIAELHRMCEPQTELTYAQLEALRCIADGMRHAAAANRLGISESALKLRLSSAREKLMARTTAEAIQRAKDTNLL